MVRRESAQVLAEIEQWFANGLGCVPAKREFVQARYMLSVIDEDDTESVVNSFERFIADLSNYASTSCLFVFNNPLFYLGNGKSGLEAITYIAEMMAPISDISVYKLIHGGNLNKPLALKCPVTGIQTVYHDFDALAFYPQAGCKDDPLYDPLAMAPYICANFNSDTFGFAMLVRDRCLQEHGCEVFELTDLDTIAELFSSCSKVWHKWATRTVQNYVDMTDVSLCPTHLTSDGNYWLANHQDPAFAETEKRPFYHEMPAIYTPKIIAKWTDFFASGLVSEYNEITVPGKPA